VIRPSVSVVTVQQGDGMVLDPAREQDFMRAMTAKEQERRYFAMMMGSESFYDEWYQVLHPVLGDTATDDLRIFYDGGDMDTSDDRSDGIGRYLVVVTGDSD
jgi:hypothetical protein